MIGQFEPAVAIEDQDPVRETVERLADEPQSESRELDVVLQPEVDRRVDLETTPALTLDVVGGTPEDGPDSFLVGVAEKGEFG